MSPTTLSYKLTHGTISTCPYHHFQSTHSLSQPVSSAAERPPHGSTDTTFELRVLLISLANLRNVLRNHALLVAKRGDKYRQRRCRAGVVRPASRAEKTARGLGTEHEMNSAVFRDLQMALRHISLACQKPLELFSQRPAKDLICDMRSPSGYQPARRACGTVYAVMLRQFMCSFHSMPARPRLSKPKKTGTILLIHANTRLKSRTLGTQRHRYQFQQLQ